MTFGTEEKIDEATTPDEMRRAIMKYGRHDSMVNAVNNLADYRGLSGEDRYVIIAYNALKERDVYRRNVLQNLELNPTRHIVAIAEKGTRP